MWSKLVKRPILISLVLLFSISFFIRIYKLDTVPSSLYYDEVDLGYQARSLIETQKDYRGRLSPFYVLSFNDPRVPIPAYITTISTILFSQEEFQVRFPGVILGTLASLLTFLIIKMWTKSVLGAFIVGFVFATNPWQIHNSRWPLEGIYSIVFYLTSSYFFFKALKNYQTKYLFLTAIFFSLTIYTYRTMSFMVPVSMFILSLLYYKNLLQFKIRNLLIAVLFPIIIIIPFIYFTTVSAPDLPRIAQISIFSNPFTWEGVHKDRQLDSNDFGDSTIGKSADKTSFIFHNKPLVYAHSFFKNYFQTFSTEFLFLDGAFSRRESVGEMGQLLYIDVLGLIAGLLFIARNFSQKHYQFLLILFLIAPIPASLTMEGARNGSRLFIFSIPLLLIVGLGWWQIIQSILRFKYQRIALSMLCVVWIMFFAFYLHRYFVHYPVSSAGDFGYGFKQAMQKINQVSPEYTNVYMSARNDPPIIYYLFWSHTKPSELQKYGSDFFLNKDYGKPLDKLKVVKFSITPEQQENLGQYLKPGVLYLFTNKDIRKELKTKADVPKGVKVIDIIHYPDNSVGFYLFARDNENVEKPEVDNSSLILMD